MPASFVEAPMQETVTREPARVATPLENLAPLAILHNALRFWWVLCLLMLLGGSIGWLAHRARPPLYEATGRLQATIDYVATGPMTQYQEDVALNAIGQLAFSDAVAERVVQQAQGQGIAIDFPSLKQMAHYERKFTVWELRIRNHDPETARRLTQIWIEQGQAALEESYVHAVQAAVLGRTVDALEDCLTEAVRSEPSGGLCNAQRFPDLQSDLQAAGRMLATERAGSHGLFVGLLIGPPEGAQVGDRPVLYGQGNLVLAGSMIGLVLGLWLVQSSLLLRWLGKG